MGLFKSSLDFLGFLKSVIKFQEEDTSRKPIKCNGNHMFAVYTEYTADARFNDYIPCSKVLFV